MRRLPQRVFNFYWGQGIADDVPALTYYLLLSLAPFALGVAALEALLLEDFLSALEVAAQLNRFLPDAVHSDVEGLVESTRDNSPWLLAIAVAAMLWTSSGAIGVIERCESRLLDCERHNVFYGRIRNVAMGALVAVAFAFAAAGAPVIGDVLRSIALGGNVTTFLLNTLGSIVVFAVIYRYAPRSRMNWSASFVGALPAGFALQAVPWLIGLYFDAAAGFAVERLFLLLAVLLLGLYVMAMLMLLGAGVAVRTERRLRDHALATRRGRVSTAPAPASTGEAASTAYSGAGPSTS
ncbi:MAG TPA: YhjD/YihY/BrkB family envelope integrity protein [Solirubrobacteraceae bacterium]|nr:YhjD/YihY/BrkB family envelope integrity protein [Solirubrobacteraceae bacterium]